VAWAPVTHGTCARQPEGGEGSPDQGDEGGRQSPIGVMAFSGKGAAPVDDDSGRDHHENEGDMANPNLGPLGPGNAPERAGDKGGGCGSGMELDGGSWVCAPVVL
jgi:hypothetical protein